jgi:hypothetical protein
MVSPFGKRTLKGLWYLTLFWQGALINKKFPVQPYSTIFVSWCSRSGGEKNIERTHQEMGNYDYDNTFNIVKREKTPGSEENLVPTKTRDLFKDYAILMPDEVAWSNKLYRTWTAEIWFEQNLKLSFDFLENHCSEEFWDKTMDKYNC